MKTSNPISPKCTHNLNLFVHEGSGVVEGGELCPAVDVEEGAPSKRSRVQEVDEDQGEEQDQDESEEARAVKAPPIPSTPSREEVRQHRLTHRPFRSWCPHCVRGKGRNDQHRKSPQKDEPTDAPKIVADYFFIGQRRPKEKEDREAE